MRDEKASAWDFVSSSFILHPSSLILWWRSELESNQPFGFFGPALIRLSYPTLFWSLVFGLRSLYSCFFALRAFTPKEKFQRPKDPRPKTFCSRRTFSITSRSSCASMKRYLRHSARTSA